MVINLSEIVSKRYRWLRLNLVLLGFLNEAKFGKGPKVLCRILGKFRNFGTLLSNLKTFIPLAVTNSVLNTLFVQRAGPGIFCSTKTFVV